MDGPYLKGVAQSVNHMSDQKFYQTWGVAPLPAGSAGSAGRHYSTPTDHSIPPLASPPASVAKELDNPITQSFVKNIIPQVIKPDWGAHYSAAYLDVMAGIQKAMTSAGPISAVAAGIQTSLKSDLGG